MRLMKARCWPGVKELKDSMKELMELPAPPAAPNEEPRKSEKPPPLTPWQLTRPFWFRCEDIDRLRVKAAINVRPSRALA